ncbi:hypothetical protein [Parafilimonas terrae]|uniref:Uncharacterized protein n=1 Tax=Parafilimonas terrae TaxID=1465490 RepID=A0A1I5YH57_9BACT|nr:hypothetical protein [Parafilimonas terrae]SFQ43470.1 hypothetical protein SAMN05444277_11235 [Parafilimonas terrae]
MMKQGFSGYMRIAFLTIIGAFALSGSMAQHIYVDTITYAGTLKFKKGNIYYKRIKAVAGSLNGSFVMHDPEPYPEDETLLLFDEANNCILNFKLNEVLADHEDATIMTTECLFTDTSLILTRYSYWNGLCNGCQVGIEHFTYGFNNAGVFCLKDSSSAFTYDPKEKLKLSKKDKSNFRRVLIQSPILDETDRKKLYEYLE